MRVRTLAATVLLGTAALSAQSPAPPEAQQPVFRTGVDLLTVDASVIDGEGRQVTDLAPEEFVVEVDGRTRPVVSAEYVRLAGDPATQAGARRTGAGGPPSDGAFFSSNARPAVSGRHILLLVDQGNIRAGQGREAMRSAAAFVDGLSPTDRVAMVAIPRGALVDFTTEHERVREALLATAGLASPYRGRFYMSLSEAIAAAEHSDSILRAQLIGRECAAVLAFPLEAIRCEIEVEQDAREYVSHVRQQTQASLVGMREVLRSLAVLDGPKSVILISEGLVLEGLGTEVEEIASIAADVRASLDVMLLDVPAVDVAERERPTTPREDRERQTAGLEALAGTSRGGLHRVFSSSENAFTRIMRSLTGHYLLGVEAQPGDRDGRRHRITVRTTRRGVTIRSRRSFLTPASPAATSPAEAVTRALRAPLTVDELPMRMATWTYKEPGGARVRLLITAEVERLADQSLEYTSGMLVVRSDGTAVASPVETQPFDLNESQPGVAVYAGSLLVDPGRYVVRFAAADSEGRLGSIERRVDAWQMDTGELAFGDLLVGPAPGSGGGIMPAIEPSVTDGRLAALLEVYAPSLPAGTLEATLEVLTDESAPPLLTAPLQIASGSSPEIGVVQGVVSTAALPPGRYLARATVRQEGKARGHLTRPFRVVPALGAAGAAGSVPTALPAAVLEAMLSDLPSVERSELMAPAVLAAVLGSAESARPAAKSALAAAREGRLGPAALDALASGDQVVAALLRGIELLGAGDDARAIQQLQIALQQAPTFTPVRLYLGAALAQANRHRDAAALLQSVGPDVAGPLPVARMAAANWLKAGDAANAIGALERANLEGDRATDRTLALAYVAGNRPADAVPVLARYLEEHPSDRDALLAALYATYATHSPSPRRERLAEDVARAETWARTYASQKGKHRALVDAWLQYLRAQR